MIYTTGTIAGNGSTITGTGTNFTAAGSLIRVGCTLIAFTNPVQVLQITAITSSAALSVTPAISPAIAGGTGYAILLSDSLSVDGLAQDIAETFGMYQRNMSGFADVMNGTTDVTITINGVQVTVPGQKSLAKKGANSDITSLSGLTTALSVTQGGTGGNTPPTARAGLGVPAGIDAQMCTAWGALYGTASSAPLAAHNISSITLLQAGIYQVNFAVPMASVNYAVNVTVDPDADVVTYFSAGAAPRSVYIPQSQKKASNFRIYSGSNAATSVLINMRIFNISVFGGK